LNFGIWSFRQRTFSGIFRSLKRSDSITMTKAFTAPANRIEAIDILRGFTLLGILIVHMVEQYYAGQWPEQYQKAIYNSIADNIVGGFISIFISGKFYMIFSFLFGLSFFIQFSKSDSDKNFLVRFLWRLILLFGIGLLHHLHYRGDILSIYALLGLGLLIFYRLNDKYLLGLALFLILNIPSVITRTVQLFFTVENPFDQNQEVLLAYFNTLKSGSYLDILRANFYEFAFKMEFQVLSGRLYITLGLFLLGVYAGRKKFFENVGEKIPVIKRLRFFSWMTIVGSFIFALIFFGGAALLNIKTPDQVNFLFGGFVVDLFNTALAAIYVMWILLWLQKDKWQKRLRFLYPIGRMGLTVYLMQTAMGTLLFFSYGFGLLGNLNAWMCFLCALVLFSLQIVFAKFWLHYFTYGPIEWIWRNFTYLKIYPIMVQRKPAVLNMNSEPHI
jgi:uncharacterized protein